MPFEEHLLSACVAAPRCRSSLGEESRRRRSRKQSFVVRSSKASQRQLTGPKGTEPAAIWRNTSPLVKSRVGQRQASPLMEEQVA